MRIGDAKDWIEARPAWAYAAAVLLASGSLGLRLLILPHQHGLPFLTFLPAIFITTYIGGRGPGLLAMAVSGILAWRFLFPAAGQFGFPWSSSAVALFVYFLVGIPLVWLIDAFFRAYRRMTRAEAAREDLLRGLEQRVETRTAELVAANAKLREEMSGRHMAEEKVAQYERLEAVGQLVGGISHDFNNLLSIIIGNLDLAQRRVARGDTQIGQHIDAAFDGARRGATLTRRLLAFARKQPLQPAVTDINALISHMADMLGSTLGEHIAVDLQLSDGLWTSRIDPSQLENAILNLAINGRDAMALGGRLTIATHNADLSAAENAGPDVSPGEYAVIVVSDTGTGMTEEVLSRAFEPFFTTKTVGQGTGLGLSQIHGYLKQSGGHADIASKPGEGTRVQLYLPRYTGADAAKPVMATEAPAIAAHTPVEKVLVVEDEEGVRAVAVQTLQDLNYAVIEASSGAAALDLLAGHPDIGLLFTDVVMPGMMGSELAQRAVTLRPQLKVLYTSGYPYDAVVQNGQLAPGVEMLQKPFTPDQLARKLHRVLAD